MPTSDGSKKTPVLLLAEDDRDSAFLFERIFRQVCPRWDFVNVEDGSLAVTYIQEKGLPDFLVTDLNMPRMNGYDLISWVRARENPFRLPVVVTSSLFDPEVKQKCEALGADELVAKGASIANLRGVLKRFAEMAERELEQRGDDGA